MPISPTPAVASSPPSSSASSATVRLKSATNRLRYMFSDEIAVAPASMRRPPTVIVCARPPTVGPRSKTSITEGTVLALDRKNEAEAPPTPEPITATLRGGVEDQWLWLGLRPRLRLERASGLVNKAWQRSAW